MPRSMPIGTGGALGSKMSRRAIRSLRGVCVVGDFVDGGGYFVEESACVADLAQERDHRVSVGFVALFAER